MVLEHMNVMTLSMFNLFWGVAFIGVTVLVAACKAEEPCPPEEEPEDVKTAYLQMVSIFKLRSMRPLFTILFTWKIAFPILEQVAPLKLQDAGVPKEHLAYMTSLLMPLYILCPIFVAKWTSGPKPLSVALTAYPLRVALVPCMLALTYIAPSSVTPTPWLFYGAILTISATGAVVSETMFVAEMAFFNKISDPAIGGTYMTMLNTIANLGRMWPPTLTFYLIDWTSCNEDACTFKRDGFYVMAVICTVIGVIWYLPGSAATQRLELLKDDEWRIKK